MASFRAVVAAGLAFAGVGLFLQPAGAEAAPLAAARALAHSAPTSVVEVGHRRYSKRPYYYGKRRRTHVVDAPFAYVESGRRTYVEAPFTTVYVGRRGRYVRAPFVDLYIPY